MAAYSQRDKSRTSEGKTRSMVRKHTAPPAAGACDQTQRWQWLTVELMSSCAFRTLSANSSKAFFRIIIEHVMHGALNNGKLVVTHGQFIEHGVTPEYVADAIDELSYKGLIKVKRGRAGNGVSHPNLYTLTFVGDHEGAPPTNDFLRVSEERCRKWADIDRKLAAEARGKVGRKKKKPTSEFRNSPASDFRNSSVRAVAVR